MLLNINTILDCRVLPTVLRGGRGKGGRGREGGRKGWDGGERGGEGRERDRGEGEE